MSVIGDSLNIGLPHLNLFLVYQGFVLLDRAVGLRE